MLVFCKALKIVVVAGAIYSILLAWNVDVTAWLASAGVIGIAVGFAAKSPRALGKRVGRALPGWSAAVQLDSPAG